MRSSTASQLARQTTDHAFLVVTASGLQRRELLRLPSPFVVVTVDTIPILVTKVVKRSVNPFWNEEVEQYVQF